MVEIARRESDALWWRSAVIYQVYPRSFSDHDGDGLGDIPGLIAKLDYLADLGVDAVWISPFYSSPLHDGGYDVTDYRSIDERLGTMADVRTLIDEAHDRGIRVLMDIVPNHTSSQHEWFQELLVSEPHSSAWDRYLVRTGRGEDGCLPPNNWRSVFHGEAWTQLTLADGSPSGSWYLHLFDSTQPDLDWSNREVIEEFHDILRFWFDLGVDGFRIDVAHGLVKAVGLPDTESVADAEDDTMLDQRRTPYWDQDGVHEIYRGWRAVADSYDEPRIFCGEAWVESEERLARYLRPDELHTSFNFEYLKAGWDGPLMREVIDQTIATHASVGAPPTWVLSNHDVIRHRTRLAPGYEQGSPDLERGLRRARAATAFTLALPGSAYLFQGEELGLPEADLPDEARQDPAWHRSGGTDGFRDGCRVPLPWGGNEPSYGFGPGSQSWLPQPAEWAELAVAVQDGDESSTLEFYRRLLAARRAEPAMGEGRLDWIDALADDPGVLALRRTAPDGSGVDVILNLDDQIARIPSTLGTSILVQSGAEVAVLAEDPASDAHLVLGPETCVWLRTASTAAD